MTIVLQLDMATIGEFRFKMTALRIFISRSFRFSSNAVYKLASLDRFKNPGTVTEPSNEMVESVELMITYHKVSSSGDGEFDRTANQVIATVKIYPDPTKIHNPLDQHRTVSGRVERV